MVVKNRINGGVGFGNMKLFWGVVSCIMVFGFILVIKWVDRKFLGIVFIVMVIMCVDLDVVGFDVSEYDC